MQALILKDFYVMWKQTRIFLLVILVFSAIPGSFNAVFAVIYSAMLPYTAMAYDERSKWNQLAAMMPYSDRDIVLSKYAFGWLFILAATAASLVLQAALSLVWPAAGSASPAALLLALCGLFFACILGLVFGILSVLKNRACNIIATVFVDIIRGVPMIVLAFYVYFAVPMLLNNILHLNTMLGMKGQITFSALQAGTICLALNCGAYMAEIIRAGIESVDKGQMEAARSLGLPYWRAMYRVVLPQAIRTMIPSIINQFIITLKDTSILSVIGFPELVNTAKNVVANTMSAFQVWTIVAVMYLVVITLLSRLAKKVERRLNRGRQ